MKNIKTLLRGSIVALMLVTPAWASPKTVTLNVSGMTCAACPVTVRKALEKVPGVSKIEVRYEKKQVLVTFDDAKTNTDALVKAATRQKYFVEGRGNRYGWFQRKRSGHRVMSSNGRSPGFTALLDRYPQVRSVTRAAVYVGERRWNLRLKDGLDIRLPENDVGNALALLSKLDRDDKLFSRDITAVDMRLPDRLSVQLSEDAGKARDELFKDKKTKKKAGDA